MPWCYELTVVIVDVDLSLMLVLLLLAMLLVTEPTLTPGLTLAWLVTETMLVEPTGAIIVLPEPELSRCEVMTGLTHDLMTTVS